MACSYNICCASILDIRMYTHTYVCINLFCVDSIFDLEQLDPIFVQVHYRLQYKRSCLYCKQQHPCTKIGSGHVRLRYSQLAMEEQGAVVCSQLHIFLAAIWSVQNLSSLKMTKELFSFKALFSYQLVIHRILLLSGKKIVDLFQIT